MGEEITRVGDTDHALPFEPDQRQELLPTSLSSGNHVNSAQLGIVNPLDHEGLPKGILANATVRALETVLRENKILPQ